jgi:mRNA interferase MazF
MKRGEVWWVAFGQSVGGEIRKRRPAVVVTNDVAIAHLNRVQVVPPTTNVGRVYPGEAIVTINDRPHKAMADQLTTVSTDRIMAYFGELSTNDIEQLEAAVRLHLGL